MGHADLHIHTKASDGVATVREVLDHVRKRGSLDVIAITDHDRVDAALWAYDRRREYPFEIIPGTEVSTTGGHVLGLWVTKPIPKGLTLTAAVKAIHEQDGLALLAHPFHVHLGVVRHNFARYSLQPQVLVDAGLDGLEVHNAGIVLPGANLCARLLAHRSGLAMTGSSDAHTLGAIGSGITRFPGHTADELRRAILQRNTIAEGTAWPLIDYWNYSRGSIHNTSNEFLAESLS